MTTSPEKYNMRKPTTVLSRTWKNMPAATKLASLTILLPVTLILSLGYVIMYELDNLISR